VTIIAVEMQKVLHILSVAVALFIQQATCVLRINCIVVCGSVGCTIFFHTIP